MTKKIRIGVVPYMNAKPLIYGLNQLSDTVEVLPKVPSLLPKMLNNNDIDVALIPSIEYFRNSDYAIIPDISISSIGSVDSVKIFSKVPINNIRITALDKSSLTSHVLTKIIFSERYHILPEYVSWDMSENLADSEVDAVLIIGDNAMKVFDNGYVTLDLGQAWYDLTGLPFVYAVWVVKQGCKIAGINMLLKKAKESGVKSAEFLSGLESKRLQLTRERCLNYLTKSIRYNLGKAELNGLEKFYHFAESLGLAPKGREIVFHAD